jgi:outer membrane protein OmpA-like peptidoglycan-associated protein
VLLVYDDSESYKLIERSDWARYDNGKYVGYVYREVRGSLSPAAPGEFRGTFYVLEETLRDLRGTAPAVDKVRNAAFRLGSDGSFVPLTDNGFPSLRGFPAFPKEPVAVGDKWTARFSRAVDPRNTGKPAVLPLIAEFEYRGEEVYKGQPVRRIFAKYATRYRGGASARTAPPFSEATGTHDVDILVHAETGRTVLIRDRLDETFKYPDGSTVRFRGFTLTFSEGSLGGGRASVAAVLRGGGPSTLPQAEPPAEPARAVPAAEPAGAPPEPLRSGGEAARAPFAPFELAAAPDGVSPVGITVEETDAGIKLTVKDLRFVADSDRLLPEERGRLEILAKALRDIPDRTFLVEGHTAAVELSKQRAKRIVDELAARGIPADRFLYKGWGGTKPLAPNDTEPERAKNRRVEITVLD